MEIISSYSELYVSLIILVWGGLPLVSYITRTKHKSGADYKIPSKLIIFHVLSYVSLALLFVIKSAKKWLEYDDENEEDGKKRYQMYLVCDIVAFFLCYVLCIGSFFLSDSFVVERHVMGLDKLGEYFQKLCKASPDSHIEVTARDVNMAIVRSSKVRVKTPCVTDKTQPLSVLGKVQSGIFRLRFSLDVQWTGNAKAGIDNAKKMLIERESAKGDSVSTELVNSIKDMHEEILVVKSGRGLPWYFSLGASAIAGFLLLGLNFAVLLNSRVPIIYHTITKEISAEKQEATQTETKKTV